MGACSHTICVCLCVYACMSACIYILCVQASGLCTSECWHQIRVFIITAVLIMREDSRDRHRLGKHWRAERHGTLCLLHTLYQNHTHMTQKTHFQQDVAEWMGNTSRYENALIHYSVWHFLPETWLGTIWYTKSIYLYYKSPNISGDGCKGTKSKGLISAYHWRWSCGWFPRRPGPRPIYQFAYRTQTRLHECSHPAPQEPCSA